MPRNNAQRIRRALDSLAANFERRDIEVARWKGGLDFACESAVSG